MEKCIYNGEIIHALEIYKNFELEQEIRNAGREHRLHCCDTTCKTAIFYRYGGNAGQHGLKSKIPHFYHQSCNNACHYEKHLTKINRRNPVTKEIISEFFDVLKIKYEPTYIVSQEDNLVPQHWSDISIKNSNQTIAIDFIYKYKGPKVLDNLLSKYKDTDIQVIIIIIDKITKEKFEYDFNYAKRLMLDNGNGILIMCDTDTEKINLELLKNDNTVYDYDIPSLFVHKISLEELDLVKEPNFCPSFEKNYFDFVENRKNTALEMSTASLNKQENMGSPKLLSNSSTTSSINKFCAKKERFKNNQGYDFFIKHKDNYPLDAEVVVHYFNQYFDSEGVSRKFAYDIIKYGCEYDEETRKNFVSVCDYKNKNSSAFFIKIKIHFASLLRKYTKDLLN